MSLFWNANWEFITRRENLCVGLPVRSKHRAVVVSMVVIWSHDKKNRNVRWNHSRGDITKAWMSFACKCMVNKSIFMLRPVAKLGDSKIQPYTVATLIFKSWCYLWEWRRGWGVVNAKVSKNEAKAWREKQINTKHETLILQLTRNRHSGRYFGGTSINHYYMEPNNSHP